MRNKKIKRHIVTRPVVTILRAHVTIGYSVICFRTNVAALPSHIFLSCPTKDPYTPDVIQLRDANFQFLKVNKAMYEIKLQEIFKQYDPKNHSASKYLDS